MSETVTGRPDGAAIPLDSLPQNFFWNGDKISHIEVEYPPASGNVYRQTFNYLTGKSITSVTVGGAGSFAQYNGYSFNGPGEGAVLTPVFNILSASLGVGGSGYTAGDILNVVGGTHSVQGQLIVDTVSSGVITAVSVHTAGVYTAIPSAASQPLALAGGTGSGATANILWKVASMTVVNGGAGYTGASSIIFSTSGTAPTGTLVLSSTDATTLDSISGWELQS